MRALSTAKLHVKRLLIFFTDVTSGNAGKFARKRIGFDFPHRLELSQEIKPSETLANKLHNIRLVSDKIQHVILLPDEILSFWKVIGNPEKILKKSRSIVNGKLRNEAGGGICQVSGIVYHLSLIAGLEIVERHNHSLDIYTDETRFAPLGSDATLVFGYKDLRIRNNFDFALKFEFVVSDTRIICRLFFENLVLPRELDFSLTESEGKIEVGISFDGSFISCSSYLKMS
ncbi:VanW family protein [Flavobacterium sp.]|uniref:VanW family protein n=1 Tax=Flavobacterium sp. TaxID=239 RepID=UPI0011F4D3B0|nr:VanW family protein [Flavobacterium sp.]RZJ71052.1 MAG: vancomycin resistance protein [Flavobacterium sp.]